MKSSCQESPHPAKCPMQGIDGVHGAKKQIAVGKVPPNFQVPPPTSVQSHNTTCKDESHQHQSTFWSIRALEYCFFSQVLSEDLCRLLELPQPPRRLQLSHPALPSIVLLTTDRSLRSRRRKKASVQRRDRACTQARKLTPPKHSSSSNDATYGGPGLLPGNTESESTRHDTRARWMGYTA